MAVNIEENIEMNNDSVVISSKTTTTIESDGSIHSVSVINVNTLRFLQNKDPYLFQHENRQITHMQLLRKEIPKMNNYQWATRANE